MRLLRCAWILLLGATACDRTVTTEEGNVQVIVSPTRPPPFGAAQTALPVLQGSTICPQPHAYFHPGDGEFVDDRGCHDVEAIAPLSFEGGCATLDEPGPFAFEVVRDVWCEALSERETVRIDVVGFEDATPYVREKLELLAQHVGGRGVREPDSSLLVVEDQVVDVSLSFERSDGEPLAYDPELFELELSGGLAPHRLHDDTQDDGDPTNRSFSTAEASWEEVTVRGPEYDGRVQLVVPVPVHAIESLEIEVVNSDFESADEGRPQLAWAAAYGGGQPIFGAPITWEVEGALAIREVDEDTTRTDIIELNAGCLAHVDEPTPRETILRASVGDIQAERVVSWVQSPDDALADADCAQEVGCACDDSGGSSTAWVLLVLPFACVARRRRSTCL